MSTNDNTSGIRFAFERSMISLQIEQLVPLKTLREGVKTSKKYQQIKKSVQAVGIIEPPAVFPSTKESGKYFLLDGLLRIEALKDLGFTDVECLVATEDEAYTYNKRINRLAAVQEHKMIVRAVERGVPEERIAEALGLDILTIRRRFRMLNGICPDAVEVLKDTVTPISVFDILRQMAPIRQLEAAELMVGQGNFSLMFARALLAATPERQLIAPRRNKPKGDGAVTPEQIARMERELASLQTQVKFVEESFGVDTLRLTVTRGYVAKLLANARIVRWLAANRQEYLSEFQNIAEIESISGNNTAAE